MPLISVVTPIYNGEKTIKETIKSILNQTFSDLELIVINDGSQDSTLKVISTIQDPRLKVLSYLNSGVSASRNRGLAQATGEFISFIDADDLWTTNKLETQLRVLQENPQAAVAYSWTDWIDESGQILGKGSYITQEGNVFAQMLLNDFVASGSNCLIRRQALIEVGGFDESLAHGEDWDLWLRLAARYEFIAIPSPQILYRISSSSASSDVWKMEAGSLKIIEKAYAIAPESLQHLKKQSLGNRYKYLTFKALEGTPERKKGLASARFLYHAISNDLSLLQAKVIWKVLFKIIVITLLPSRLAQVVLAKFKAISNTVTLLGYMKLDVLKG